jgi:hypothetical protein
MSVNVVASNPAVRQGKRTLIVTAKGTSDADTFSTAIKRTISGESAELQIKSVRDSSGSIEIVHLHCLRDKATSAYKRGKAPKIEELYDIIQVLRIRCKICGREWFNDGFTCETHVHSILKQKSS